MHLFNFLEYRYISVFLTIAIITVILILLYLPTVWTYFQIALYAIQFVLYPYGLISRRSDFEKGMDVAFSKHVVMLDCLYVCLLVCSPIVQCLIVSHHSFALSFYSGMDLVLQVMSLGTMSRVERARRIAAKWIQLVESSENDAQ